MAADFVVFVLSIACGARGGLGVLIACSVAALRALSPSRQVPLLAMVVYLVWLEQLTHAPAGGGGGNEPNTIGGGGPFGPLLAAPLSPATWARFADESPVHARHAALCALALSRTCETTVANADRHHYFTQAPNLSTGGRPLKGKACGEKS